MKKKPNKKLPAVTWVTLPPESSARTSLKSIDEYLSEIQDDMPKPPRRLCLSPETLKALENAERMVEDAERQLSKMNFNSIITEELESEKFNGNANEEDQIYIRNVVASTLKRGFYDPTSSAALADHLKPRPTSCDPRYPSTTHESCRPRYPSKAHGFPEIPKEPSIDPREPELACLVCASGRERRAAGEAPRSIPEAAGGKDEAPQERLTVHRAPDVSIKAELAVRTAKIVDIQPQQSASSAEPRGNVATFEVRHESARLAPEPPAEVQTSEPRVVNEQKHEVRGKKFRHPTSQPENRRRQRRRREEVAIDDIPVGELSLTEPRILADIDSLLGRQRAVIRQLNRFDEFLASKLPGEQPWSVELGPPAKIASPAAAASEDNGGRCANSKLRKPEELEEKRRHAVESTGSNEDGSSTASSEEVEIAKVDYTESFESASSVAGTRSDAGFVEDLQEANLDAGARGETDEGPSSSMASEVDVEVNVEVDIDEGSIDEDKDGSATEKLQGSSQKTSHLIDSIPDTTPDRASEVSSNSLKLSTVSDNVASTESKIESRISEVRENLDSLLRSIDGSERADKAGAKTPDEVLNFTDVSAENRHDIDRNYRDRSKSLSQVDQANQVVDENSEADDLIEEFTKGRRTSEKSANQSSRNNGTDKNNRSKNSDSQNDLIKQFPSLDGGTCKMSIRDNNTNRRERDEVKLKSQSSTLDDISEQIKASFVDKTVTNKTRQSKDIDDKSDQINNNDAIGKNNRSNEPVDGSDSIEHLIIRKSQEKQLPAVDEVPKALKVLMKNDFVETKAGARNSQDEYLRYKGVSKSLEAPNRCDLIDTNDHRQDKVQEKQQIILDGINVIDREYNLTNRSLMTLLEENSVEVRDSVQQQKLTLLKILESCSIPSSYRGKRVFTSTVLGDLEPPSSFARLKESSQSESSSDTYSEGEVRFSSSTSHSAGEIRRKSEFSKSSSLTKTASSGSFNPTISVSRSAGEVSEIAVDSLR